MDGGVEQVALPGVQAAARAERRGHRQRDASPRGGEADPHAARAQRPRIRLALVLALGLALTLPGCARAPLDRDSFELRHVALQDGFLRLELKIPYRPAGAKPVVIGPFGDDRELLDRGVIVADFHHDWSPLHELAEARDPGEATVGKALLASPRPGVIGRGYFQLVELGARRSIPAIIDHLVTLPDVDPDRIAVAGSSTRGFMALEALVADARLAAGVVRVACGDYHEFLRSSSLALAGEERWLENGRLSLDADYERELSAREPIRSPDRFPPRPLLLLAGGRDPVVPLTCVQRTARALAAAYAARGQGARFRFVLYPEAGHDLGGDAVREMLAWWDRWLLGEEAPLRTRR
jgi:dienelactone hydrolase